MYRINALNSNSIENKHWDRNGKLWKWKWNWRINVKSIFIFAQFGMHLNVIPNHFYYHYIHQCAIIHRSSFSFDLHFEFLSLLFLLLESPKKKYIYIPKYHWKHSSQPYFTCRNQWQKTKMTEQTRAQNEKHY